MPHEVLAFVLEYIKNGPGNQAQAMENPWQLIVMWCVMEAQQDSQGDSLVSFSIEAITEGDDAYFGQWMDTTEACMGAPLAGTAAEVLAHFAAELGKGVALGLHALGGPFKTPAMAQGGTGDANSKKGYGEEDITALMGLLHIKQGHQLQDIWSYFQSLGGKNIDVCQQQLMA
jgi:hypothetical protein